MSLLVTVIVASNRYYYSNRFGIKSMATEDEVVEAKQAGQFEDVA